MLKKTPNLRPARQRLHIVAVLPFCAALLLLLLGSIESTSSESPSRLSDLKIVNPTILYLKEAYVDPSRIDPQKMLVAALKALERKIPELVVSDPKDGAITIQVGPKEARFGVDDLESLWGLSFRLKEIFTFIEPLQEDFQNDELEYDAINGMLSTLDPHSLILEPQLAKEMRLATKDEFGGLGVVLSMKDGFFTVMGLSPKGPALKAGIHKGDRIIKVDGARVENSSLNKLVSKLRGKPKTVVQLSVLRKNESKMRTFLVVREMIPIDEMTEKLLPGDIAYLHVKSFHSNTARNLHLSLRKMKKNAPNQLKGLILDLRDNPGGLVNESVALVDIFLDKGALLATRGSKTFSLKAEEAQASFDDELKIPIVVLVGGGSASASEIVAGALKYRERALIVGQRTFGKGSVQMLFDYNNDAALKLTIAEYLAAGVHSIQAAGIIPDVLLRPISIATMDQIKFSLDPHKREEDLQAHLSSVQREQGPAPLVIDYFAPQQNEVEDEAKSLNKEYVEDAEILLAQRILAATSGQSVAELKKAAEVVANQDLPLRSKEIEKALAKLGIDWTASSSDLKKANLRFKTLKPAVAQAGQTLMLNLEIYNAGDITLNKLYGVTESATNFFADKEVIVGKLAPGQKIVRNVLFKLPKDILTRRDTIRISFKTENNNSTLARVDVPIEVIENPRATLSYSATITKKASQDKSSSFNVAVDLRNIGKGDASDIIVGLDISDIDKDSDIIVEPKRHKIALLKSNAKKQVHFVVSKIDKATNFKLQMVDSASNNYWISGITLDPAQTTINNSSMNPPKISFLHDKKEPISVASSSFPVDILVESDKPLYDTYLFVNDRKVYYQSFKNKTTNTVTLHEKINLKPGVNTIVMFARQNEEFGQRQSMTVFSEQGDPLAAKSDESSISISQ